MVLNKAAWLDSKLSPSKRSFELLAVMTLDEKIAQLCSVWLDYLGQDHFVLKSFSAESKPRPDVRQLFPLGIGQISRPLGSQPVEPREGVRALNNLQKFFREETRLGIPALPHEECLAGLMAQGATLFPAGINYGSLWNPDLIKKIASAIGRELASTGSRQGLAPVLDVARDARWGRVEETMGEDPYLVGTSALAYVQGFQGKDRQLLATLKHFVGHSFSEGGRNHAPVHIGPRELMDVFLLPFEMAVKLGNAGSVMPAYHDIDGEPCSSSVPLMKTLLREKWGFEGLIVSDYEAIAQLKNDHRVASDFGQASALALKAGMDMELPGTTVYAEGIRTALDQDLLTVSEVDAVVQRVLTEKFRLGLFEHPYVSDEALCLNTSEHKSLAFQSAVESMVLLSNDGMLPLAGTHKIAVIGPLADEPLAFFSGYSFPVHLIASLHSQKAAPPAIKTLRKAFVERLGEERVLYARGCDILSRRPDSAPVFPGDPAMAQGQRESYISYDESQISEAVKAGQEAGQLVVCLGDLSGLFLSGTVGEGSDASSLTLPGVQQKLLEALLALKKPLTIVLLNGRPYDLGEAGKKANAILEAWLPGQEGADALVHLIFGDGNPGGKLPISFPKSAGAMPYAYNLHFKSCGSPIQQDFGAVYPFGHGLSYTQFVYEDFQLESESVATDGEIRITGVVRNVGHRAGDEVVQVYGQDLLAQVVRPQRELKAYRRLSLEASQAVQVTFVIPTDLLNYSPEGQTRFVEPGEWELFVGSSSQDYRFQHRILLTGPGRTLGEQWRMLASAEVRSL